ncbi:unnamed protein product [Durusdinium trenchii]|uniref:G domain-containing protein n=1 Tax=Durusdinium trenchii TaxID=1381693 RepID=A0ABP0KKN3_9DINO
MKASQHFGRHGFDHDKIAAVLSSGKKEEVLPVLRALISAGKATIGSLQVVDRIGRLLRDRDPDVASTAAELLIAADAAGRYEEALILMLQRREDACVMAALSAFSKLGSKISPSRKDLVVHHIATCLSGSRQVHCRALRTLGELRATRQALDIQNRLENQKALFRTKPAEEVRQLQDGAQEQEVAKLREQMMHLASHCSELAKARGDASRLAEGLKEVQEALAESERSADQQDKPEVTKLREQMMHLTSDLAKATGDASRLAEELKEAQQALAESERSADQQAQQFLQKEWCWKNETAKLEEAESFAEAAAQEKDVLRMELAEKVRQLQERAQEEQEVAKLREQMMHLASHCSDLAGNASRSAADLKEAQEALAESERSADQQAQQFLQKEWCWKNETAKLEKAEEFAEAAAQEKVVLRTELAEKVRQLQEAQGKREVTKLREQMTHLTSDAPHMAELAEAAAQEKAVLRTELAEKVRQLQEAQAQQFLQKEWCWKNETAKLEEAESFAEAAAQEKAMLRTELAEKEERLQKAAQELPEAQQVFAQSEAAQRLAEAAAKEKAVLRTALEEKEKRLQKAAQELTEAQQSEKRAEQEKAVLRTALEEKEKRLQKAAQELTEAQQSEKRAEQEMAKLEEAQRLAEAAAQEKAVLRTALEEKEKRLQKAAQELTEAQQSEKRAEEEMAKLEEAQRLAEAAAQEKERAPSEKAKEGSDSSTADMERGPWDSPRTLDSCTSEGSPKEVGPGGSFHSAGGKQPAAPAASDGLTPSSTKQVNDVSDLASLSTLSTSPPAMNKDLHQVSLGQDGGEARVVVSCPEAHYDKVQKICMELDIVQAFGRKGDYVDDLDGDEWFGKWQSRVVASATTALQTRKCKNAELFCIAGGKHCHKEVGNQPMLIEAIEKAMKESKLPAVKIRFSWMKVEQFEEHIRKLAEEEIQKDAKLRKRKLLDLLEEDPQAAELFAKLTDYVELDEKSKRLVIIGDTGAGKSTFCGLLDGSLQKLKKGVDDKGMPLWEWESNFKLGHKASSETDQPQLRKCYAFGQDGEDPVPLLLMDTPGLEDSRGKKKDDDHMAEVAKWVNGLRYIHGIVILLKNDTRISRGLRNNLEFFQSIFGTDMWVHATVVVNRWPQDSRSRKKRAEGGLQSTAQFEEEFRGVLQKPRPKDATGDDCGVGLAEDKARRLPFYFVDTLYDRGEEDEKSSMRNELDNIRRWALSLQEWFVQATTQSPELKNLIHVVESTNQAADLETALEKALGVDPRPADVTRKKVEAVRKEIEVRSTADRVDEAEKALHKFEETGNREDAQTFVQKFGALNSKQAAAVSSTKMSRLNPAFEVLEKALEGKKSETETATLEVSPQFHQHAQRLIKERNEALTQLDEAVRESSTEKVVRALAKCDSLRLTDPSIPKAKTWLEETQSALGQLENAHKQKSMEAVKQALALCESLNLPADKLQIARTWLKAEAKQVLDTAVEQAESIKKVREALLFCESVGVPPDDLRKAHHWLEDEQKVQRLIEEFDEKYGLGLSKEFDSFTKAVKLWVREHGVTGTLGHMETRFERLKQIVNEFPKMTEVSKIKVCTLIKSTKLNPQSTRKEWQDVLDPAREHGMNGLQLQKLQTDYDNRLFFHGDIVTMETNRWDDHYVYVSDDHNYVFARKRSTLEGYELTKASWRLHIDGDLHKFESMKCSGRYLCAMDHETNKLWVGISKGSIEEDRCRWKLEPDGSYYGLWNERGDFTHALTFHNHEPGFGRPYCARIPRIGGWEKVYIRRV